MRLINRLSHYLVGSHLRPAFPAQQGMTFTSGPIVPDVSFWQDKNETERKIDFAKMKAAGAAGVIIRAGQGNWKDDDFSDNWQAAQGVLPRGLYWFYDSRYPPGSQALLIKNLFASRSMPEMDIWPDFEENYNGPYAGWRHFAVFLSELQRLIPSASVGIYTNYYYWLDHSPNPITEKASFDWFAQFRLWLAWYTTNPAIVKIPRPWDKVTYWQYTDKGPGAEYGVESASIDLSRFNGSVSDFRALYDLETPIPPSNTPTIALTSIVPEPAAKTTIQIMVDKTPYTLTYSPAAPVVEPVAPAVNGLYRFNFTNWQAWGWAPPVNFLFRRFYMRSGNKFSQYATIPLNAKWQQWLKDLCVFLSDAKTGPTMYAWLCRPDAGPTQGFNGNQQLKWIVAATPGPNPLIAGAVPNTVRVIARETVGGVEWACLDHIDITQTPPAINAALVNNLGLFNVLYQINAAGVTTIPSGVAGKWRQPILSNAPIWLPMRDLIGIG